jgi:Fe2+ or Zn2+ uptake regulation protein
MSLSTSELPANYRTVLEVVSAFGDGRHASAQDIYLRARELRPAIGFATVHRALARLHDLGLILKLDIAGGDSALYEPATRAHAHFRCTVCGTVADVDFACDPALLAGLEARLGVAIQAESTTFTGRCRTCVALPG